MRRRARPAHDSEEDEDEYAEVEEINTMSSSCDLTVGNMDIESIGSGSTSQMPGNRSWGWAFKNQWAERVKTSNGLVVHCLYPGCRQKYDTKSMTTSGINRHLIKIHRITPGSGVNDGSLSRAGPLDALLLSSTKRVFDPTTFDDLLVRFIVSTKQPFTIVESPVFQELLNHTTMAEISQVKLPSGDTMSTKTKRKYLEMEEQVIALFTGVHKISLTADAWTSPFQDDFLGVTAHWIDSEWVQRELMIGFEPLYGAHTGENLAEALVNVLERFHIGEKIQSITTDNASNMGKMVRDLVQHPKAAEWSLEGKLHHIPCLGHIINLAVQSMLGPGGLNDEPPENDNLYSDDNDDEYVDEDEALFADEVVKAKLPTLKKLRKGIVKIRSSPQRIQKFGRICDIMKCPKLVLIRDVRIRWNSTFAMLDRAIDVKDAYQSMCQNETTLAEYALEVDEWLYLEKLHVLLEQFVTMTKTVSSSISYPTINRAMSVYNAMIDRLEEFIEKETDPSLLKAANNGKQKLQDYYSKTDSTPVYAVATAMDPRMRYDWWGANDWGEYIKTSKDMVTDIWNRYYKGKEGPVDMDDEIARQMKLYGIRQKAGELEEYVHEGSSLVACKHEPPELMYWRSQMERWPNLANMARDYLAIPVTSTPAERCFSQAKFVLPPERNSLLPTTIQRLVILDSWLKELS